MGENSQFSIIKKAWGVSEVSYFLYVGVSAYKEVCSAKILAGKKWYLCLFLVASQIDPFHWESVFLSAFYLPFLPQCNELLEKEK